MAALLEGAQWWATATLPEAEALLAVADVAVVHEGYSCDRSGVSPIVGPRYHMVGLDYHLCEAEYRKLPEHERTRYQVTC